MPQSPKGRDEYSCLGFDLPHDLNILHAVYTDASLYGEIVAVQSFALPLPAELEWNRLLTFAKSGNKL